MSIQACLIRGYGYRFDYSESLFSHIQDDDKEYDFIEVIGLDEGYYSLRDNKNSKDALLGIVKDGMCGEYKYVLFITEASYIENTHGDNFWRNEFRNDDYIRNYCKKNIETLLGRELGEPTEHVFEHYS